MRTLDISYQKAKKQLEDAISTPTLPGTRNLNDTLAFQEKLHLRIFETQQKLCKDLPDSKKPKFEVPTPTPGPQTKKKKSKPNTTEKLEFELDRLLIVDQQGKVRRVFSRG